MKPDTRKRILVTTLLLFNEKGEPNTSTNEIADAVDISPGNLHYHFRKKANLVDALLLEFQADARKVLQPPQQQEASLDDFWLFLHLLLEFGSAYRFLFRDMESLLVEYPKVGNALKHFARGLTASFELYLRALAGAGVIQMEAAEMASTSRNLSVISLFSERFDALVEARKSADDSALRVAGSALSMLRPFTTGESSRHLAELTSYYESDL